jgi:hypothetical protein
MYVLKDMQLSGLIEVKGLQELSCVIWGIRVFAEYFRLYYEVYTGKRWTDLKRLKEFSVMRPEYQNSVILYPDYIWWRLKYTYENDASLFSNKFLQCNMVEVDSKRKRKDGSLFDVWIFGAILPMR